MRDLRAISGPVWGPSLRVDSRVNSRSILVDSEVNSGPYLGNLKNCLHLAVGGPLRLNMTKYGSLGGWVVVPGIAPYPPTVLPPPRVHPPTGQARPRG